MTRIVRAIPMDGDRWQLAQRFTDDPSTWLPLPAAPVGPGRWRTEVHGGLLRQEVTADVSEPWRLPDAFSRHVTWVATNADGEPVGRLLPDFAGQLTLRSGSEQSWLVLTGWYQPPGGRAGEVVDAIAMRRVAERTLERVLRDVVARLRVPTSVLPI